MVQANPQQRFRFRRTRQSLRSRSRCGYESTACPAMQSIWRPTLRIHRRPSVFLAASGMLRRHPSACEERHPVPLRPAALSPQDKFLDHQFSKSDYQPWHIRHFLGVGSEKKQAGTEAQYIVHDDSLTAPDDIDVAPILPGSSHRDGAIYKRDWNAIYIMDIADRNETLSEVKSLLVPSDCYPDYENCIAHGSCGMMQIFSLRLVKAPISSGLVQLYGYMGVRDDLDGLLNYVFNRSRDDPIIVQQGSLIKMIGPKRGIAVLSDVLFEFDMRIKTGQNEEDDMQLIDGLIHFQEPMVFRAALTTRIRGDCGAVDISFAAFEYGVEATIEVAISEVQNDFDLSLSSIVCVQKVLKEVELFCCAAREMGIKRSVVAVPLGTTMHLKFKVGQKGTDGNVVHHCSFDARLHGCTNRQINLGLACISVKVKWWPSLY